MRKSSINPARAPEAPRRRASPMTRTIRVACTLVPAAVAVMAFVPGAVAKSGGKEPFCGTPHGRTFNLKLPVRAGTAEAGGRVAKETVYDGKMNGTVYWTCRSVRADVSLKVVPARPQISSPDTPSLPVRGAVFSYSHAGGYYLLTDLTASVGRPEGAHTKWVRPINLPGAVGAVRVAIAYGSGKSLQAASTTLYQPVAPPAR